MRPTHKTQGPCALACHYLVAQELAKPAVRRTVVPRFDPRRVQKRYACMESQPAMRGLRPFSTEGRGKGWPKNQHNRTYCFQLHTCPNVALKVSLESSLQ